MKAFCLGVSLSAKTFVRFACCFPETLDDHQYQQERAVIRTTIRPADQQSEYESRMLSQKLNDVAGRQPDRA